MNRIDKAEKLNNSYLKLPSIYYHKQQAAKVKQATLFVYNEQLAHGLAFNPKLKDDETLAQYLAGQYEHYYPEATALAYAGHQFGYFNRLGDGRALLLGQYGQVDLQLKGSGRTPYSRNGDGKSALGPMLREYIISEAMHGLGIPTTRSLSVVFTHEPIVRESYLPGAILCRTAASHIRVGTFEYAAQWGTQEQLKALADYTLERHFPTLLEESNPYLAMLKEVVNRQASLIASWQLVGFIHGVMNTDNMTISGETIDYGPCAFMNRFDPATVYSSIDAEGRYAYQNQPAIGSWNLTRFAESLIPLIDKEQEVAIGQVKIVLNDYANLYYQYWLDGMRAKLGFKLFEAEDEKLIQELLQIMYDEKLDYTNTFVDLTLRNFVRISSYQSTGFTQWKLKWEARLAREEENIEQVQHNMMKVNPIVIPRNEWVESVLKQAELDKNSSQLNQLLDLIKDPFSYTLEQRLRYIDPLEENDNYQTYCGT